MERQRPTPAVIRSSLLLEMAAELTRGPDLPYEQAEVNLRLQGDERPRAMLRGTGTPADLHAVSTGEAVTGISNPSSLLTVAVRGQATFTHPLPLRAVTVIPSYDQLMLAVNPGSGLTSLEEVGRRHHPLKISVRGQRDHSIHLVLEHVFAAAGFSTADLEAWGGRLVYQPGLPNPARLDSARRGEVDAVFDEAVRGWGNQALQQGMSLLHLEEPTVARLEEQGYRRSLITPERFPLLDGEVLTIDFSGWTLFVHQDAPDSLVRAMCAGLEARRDRVCWQGDGPLPLHDMCRDTPAGPLDVPLHPAAEGFWRERGYLA